MAEKESTSRKSATITRSAAALSRLGASKGGLARAARLTPEERSEIARQAASSRWGTSVMRTTHDGTLKFASREIACAVLEDGTRVINTTTFLNAFDRPRKGSRDGSLPLLEAGNLQPFISDATRELVQPIPYLEARGVRALGYRAEVLPAVCEVYLDAREHGALTSTQRPVATAAEIVLRGIARVGIVALVDEATGYQEVRAREELQRILEAYVQAQFRPWVRMFPNDFFKEIYRLQGWEFRPGTSKRTPHVGKLIKHYIYEQLPEGVLAELERMNPRNANGNRPRKHHQHLTATTGNVHLDRQISTVTTLMKIARSRGEFEELFDRAFPPPQPRLPLVIDSDAYLEG